MTTTTSGRIPRLGTKPRQKHAGRLSNLSAPHPARLPNPKPTTINKPDSRDDRETTGGQVKTCVGVEALADPGAASRDRAGGGQAGAGRSGAAPGQLNVVPVAIGPVDGALRVCDRSTVGLLRRCKTSNRSLTSDFSEEKAAIRAEVNKSA